MLARRLYAGRALLETSDWSIERVAAECGFASPITFRQNFVSCFAATPIGQPTTVLRHVARLTTCVVDRRSKQGERSSALEERLAAAAFALQPCNCLV